MFRVLVRLRKGEKIKYLSHLDLMRTFEYALRRAGIPVAYSEGFNPRPRMSFASAVGVGVTSDDEPIVIDLASDMQPDEVMARLNSKFPAGMEILSAEALPEGVKSPLGGLNATRYRIIAECEYECDPNAIHDAIEKLFASEKVPVMRDRPGQKKEIDIRPHMLSADKITCDGRFVTIEVSLGSGSSGGARAQDFMLALGKLIPGLDVRKIHKIRQFHA